MSYPLRKVIKALTSRGFVVLREGGGHTIYRGPAGQQTEVPRHKQVRRGTARNIARQAGIDPHDFEREIS